MDKSWRAATVRRQSDQHIRRVDRCEPVKDQHLVPRAVEDAGGPVPCNGTGSGKGSTCSCEARMMAHRPAEPAEAVLLDQPGLQHGQQRFIARG
jgi:hypothetical protein